MDETKLEDGYNEIIDIIYEEDKYTIDKPVMVKALIYIDSGCSFSDSEYSININTCDSFIDSRDTDLIEECIENDLEGCIGIIPEEKNIVIEMVDDGEQEDVFWNRYLTIKRVSILTLEEKQLNKGGKE